MSNRQSGGDSHVDRKILFNLCVALWLVYIVFLAGIERTENTVACKVVSGLLNYLLLAAFGWMLVESYRLYRRFNSKLKLQISLPSKFLLKGAIVSWGKQYKLRPSLVFRRILHGIYIGRFFQQIRNDL